MDNKTKIIITRGSEWLNRLRAYAVFIDGNQVGTVKNNSSEEFIVEPGVHKLYCKLAYYSSQEFTIDIKQDEIVYLRTKNALRFYWPLYILLLLGLVITVLKRRMMATGAVTSSYLQWVFILPFFLYVLYYLTAGRKKYILLEKDKNNIFSK